MSIRAIERKKKLSGVSFESGSSDEEDKKSHGTFTEERRRRRSSVFSMEGYLHERMERQKQSHLRGEFLMTHSDTPSSLLDQESSLGYNFDTTRFETRRKSRIHHMSSVSSSNDGRLSTRRRSASWLSKGSEVSEIEVKPPPNTYETEPTNKFDVSSVRLILREELDKVFHLPEVNANIVCLELTNDIRKRVKGLEFSRYKFVVIVTVGDSPRGQRPDNRSVVAAAQCFWDSDRDSFVSESVDLQDSFIVATVYAIYYN